LISLVGAILGLNTEELDNLRSINLLGRQHFADEWPSKPDSGSDIATFHKKRQKILTDLNVAMHDLGIVADHSNLTK
jgi:hypothetical protein